MAVEHGGGGAMCGIVESFVGKEEYFLLKGIHWETVGQSCEGQR